MIQGGILTSMYRFNRQFYGGGEQGLTPAKVLSGNVNTDAVDAIIYVKTLHNSLNLTLRCFVPSSAIEYVDPMLPPTK
jgi:hypothetical protein